MLKGERLRGDGGYRGWLEVTDHTEWQRACFRMHVPRKPDSAGNSHTVRRFSASSDEDP